MCNSSYVHIKNEPEKRSIFWVCLLAFSFLFLSGFSYRLIANKLQLLTNTPVKLGIGLSDIPMNIGAWTGEDVPLPEMVVKITGNDDYINRLLRRQGGAEWVNVYLAYSARPRTMIGHRPEVCYAGAGWIHEGSKKGEFRRRFGEKSDCMIHFFHFPGKKVRRRVVLNFYVVNGIIMLSESGFSGLSWRSPNIKGDAANYVAQIQVTSELENTVLSATEQICDTILDYLPDAFGLQKVGIKRAAGKNKVN